MQVNPLVGFLDDFFPSLYSFCNKSRETHYKVSNHGRIGALDLRPADLLAWSFGDKTPYSLFDPQGMYRLFSRPTVSVV